MAAKNWAYTSLSAKNSVRLSLNGVDYEVVHFTSSFAINEIPQAVCVLATGRNARDGTSAVINAEASTLKSMVPAQVYFTPVGDFDTDGTKWPKGEQLVFDGYFAGLSYAKVNGKMQPTVNLIHWLVDLGLSSCLSSRSHIANPADLTAFAVMNPIAAGAGASDPGFFLSSLVGCNGIENYIQSDLWQAIKMLLCTTASKFDGFNPLCGDADGTLRNILKTNTRALKALKRIEGPSGTGGCDMDYKYGQPLAISVGAIQQTQVPGGIAASIGYMKSIDLWNMNFWDLLVSNYCPMFGLALCPGIDRAIITADLPSWRGNEDGSMWRSVSPDEYDYTDQSAMLPRPLRAIVATGSAVFDSGTNQTSAAQGNSSCIAGIFASNSDEDADGVVMYTRVPDWINGITVSGVHQNAGVVTAATSQKPINTALTPGASTATSPAKAPADMTDPSQEMLDAYAQMCFNRECLRGRGGTVSGKLRFDIGPGSHVKFQGSSEKFLGTNDALADDIYCQVNRVTIDIDAEGRRAGTAMMLTYTRNSEENQSDRTSLAAHPFYAEGMLVKGGFPLTPAYELTPKT